jgi:transposase
LWFEDECHFQQHGSRCRMWVPPEDVDPVVFHAPTRKSIGVFGAVRADDGLFVASSAGRFDAETFQEFMASLFRHRRRDRKMVVVLDNVRWHHARLLHPWLRKHQSQLKLDFLPAYSPELNHVERVWKLTRRLCTHNYYFETLDELVETVFERLDEWSKPNESLCKLCAVI